MGLFSRKKKRSTTLTDEDREAALETRRQNKVLRDLRHQQKILEEKKKLIELNQDIAEMTEDDEEEGSLFGLDSETMQLLNIVTKGKANDLLNQAQNTSQYPNQTTMAADSASQAVVSDEINVQAQSILEALPAPLISQIKGLNPEATKRAIELIHQQ